MKLNRILVFAFSTLAVAAGATEQAVITVTPDTPVLALLPIFESGMVALVVDGDRFLGLITRIDMVNYLRRRLPASP